MSGDGSHDWKVFGAEDPYFGVLTDPRFHRECLDQERLAEFWATGEAHVVRLEQVVRAHFGREMPRARVLDYGCGVGRVLLPLARGAQRAVGVDVAPGMLVEGARAARAAGLEHIEWLEFEGGLTGLTGPFDFVHSFIVLQHIPAARGMRRIAEMLALLAPGGLAVIHVPFAKPGETALMATMRWARPRLPLVNSLVNLLARRPWNAPLMQMNVYDLNAVLREFQQAGCHRVHTAFSEHGSVLGVVLFGEKQAVAPF